MVTAAKVIPPPPPPPSPHEPGVPPAPPLPGAFFGAEQSYTELNDRIVSVPLSRATWRWIAGLGLASTVVMILLTAISYLIYAGVGIWGVDIPVAWGFAIINFVWWIGIGHAGTLISAILFLLRQPWRNSISRLAEAMTIFAVANAGLFPLLHLGRIWRFYYLVPYPDTLGLWPQWRSPLVWDVFAVATYLSVSLMFWYLGLVPDLASLRDSARRRWIARLAGIFALGWRGAARHWQNYSMAYLLLAGLATPLVVSVHTIVSLDFATAIVPGWHSTIFPPYFVAGAIYSGFAMVLTIAIPMRRLLGIQDLITTNHFNSMAKLMLATGMIVAYGYVFETFSEWLAAEPAELDRLWNRVGGPYSPEFWAMIACNVVVPQLLWFPFFRTHALSLFIISLFINVGMWLERYDIVVTSLRRDYMPSAWGYYTPTLWDWALLVGSLGFFTFLILLFVRLLPSLSIFELREQLHGAHASGAPPIAGRPENLPTPGPGAPGAPGEPEPRIPERRPEEASAREQLLWRIPPQPASLHGLLASFDEPDHLVGAIRRMRRDGYTSLDGFTPMPVEGLAEALHLPRTRVPLVVLTGGLIGGLGGYLMQWYASTIDYPWNIAGRPLHSWPSFIPLTFELTVLGASLFAFIGVLALNGLPRLYHPVFNSPLFVRATRDRFLLLVRSNDPRFDIDRTADHLRDLGAEDVSEVPEQP